MVTADHVITVREYFLNLQSEICTQLIAQELELENQQPADSAIVTLPTDAPNFSKEQINTPGGGLSQPRVFAGGKHIEKAAVQFTHSVGDSLPQAATQRNPKLAGCPFQATAISLIVHPCNPHVPTTHMNLRFFFVQSDDPVWYFGGGFDLTPFYPVDEDVVHWHQTAQSAVQEHYPQMKANCDEYFYLPHRDEHRGVGGIFFDDWTLGGFDSAFALAQRIGNAFLPAYLPIIEKRKNTPFSQQQREFQLYRRGRYAEFNLAIDRGTKYGLQSGRRIESVLASLPPLAAWSYNYVAPQGSAEAKLTDYYLQPQNWL